MIKFPPDNVHIVVIDDCWAWGKVSAFMLLVEIDHMRRKGATAEWV